MSCANRLLQLQNFSHIPNTWSSLVRWCDVFTNKNSNCLCSWVWVCTQNNTHSLFRLRILCAQVLFLRFICFHFVCFYYLCFTLCAEICNNYYFTHYHWARLSEMPTVQSFKFHLVNLKICDYNLLLMSRSSLSKTWFNYWRLNLMQSKWNIKPQLINIWVYCFWQRSFGVNSSVFGRIQSVFQTSKQIDKKWIQLSNSSQLPTLKRLSLPPGLGACKYVCESAQ